MRRSQGNAGWQPQPYFVDGQWNVICDRCGRKRKNVECAYDVWPKDNLFVCIDTCLDMFQPQDKLISIPDPMNVPIARPEGPNNVTLGPIYNGPTNGDDS